jgi:glycosyltransferase involved in cell wall biosynthesis
MANDYSLVYSEQAADFLLSLRRAKLASLLYDLRSLASDPFVRSDYRLDDGQGRQVEYLGLGNCVRFIGNVADADKWAHYRQADLFVLPTETENFGMVVAESLACGTPVLTTKGAPWSSLVSERCGWWVENSTDGIFSDLTAATSADQKTLAEMGERGRLYVEREYNWNDIGDRMAQAYSWILHGGDCPQFIRL